MKIKMMLMVLALCAASAHAWEKKANPDRFTSVGINLTGQSANGIWDTTLRNTLGNQSVKTNASMFVVDLRVPVTNWMTLNTAVGLTSVTLEAEETPYLAGQKVNQSGGMFSVGARFYFNSNRAINYMGRSR